MLGLVSVNVFAVGHDILAGTDTDLMATVQGSGRKYLYLAEGITSIAAYMKTRNFFVLGGILVVALAFNMLLKVYSGA